MVQVDIASFWSCDFFQVVQSSILGVVISFLIVKTPLLCSTDVKLSSVQHQSVSLSAYIHFSDSALSTLISAEHSDQRWTDLSEPLLSPFPANLAGEGWKLTLISADQKSALADQNMWGRDKTSFNHSRVFEICFRWTSNGVCWRSFFVTSVTHFRVPMRLSNSWN